MGVEDALVASYDWMEMFRGAWVEVEGELQRRASVPLVAIQAQLAAGWCPSSLYWQERILILDSRIRACHSARLYIVCARQNTLRKKKQSIPNEKCEITRLLVYAASATMFLLTITLNLSSAAH